MKEKARSIRKVLANTLVKCAEEAEEITGRSINDLPEYYLTVKSAEALHDHFHTFTFSMEDNVEDLMLEIGNTGEKIDIPRDSGKVDLIIRSAKRKKVKHLVEFKRGFKKEGHIADTLRLAAFCRYSPRGHKTEKNFMVMVVPVSHEQMRGRQQQIVDSVQAEFGSNIKVTPEFVDLSEFQSTRKNLSENKPLFGAVWELKYID